MNKWKYRVALVAWFLRKDDAAALEEIGSLVLDTLSLRRFPDIQNDENLVRY